MSYCFRNCPYLCKDIGYCINPAFNEKGFKLKQDGTGFVKICKLRSIKKENKITEFNCNPKCQYLNTDYGVGFCLKNEFKDNCRLEKDKNGNYIKICNEILNRARKNKYNAKKVVVNGVTYDSQLEYERYCELKMLQKAGIITDLKYHKRFVLIEKNENGREIAYEADFVYKKDGKTIVEDTKSEPTKTRLYALKKRLMLEKYGLKITEYTRKGGNNYGKELLCGQKGINLSGGSKNLERVSGLN